MDDQPILTRRVEDVLEITLNRPERLNAATTGMFDHIRDILGNLGSARAVLVRADGRGFCSGADVGSGPLGADSSAQASYDALVDHYHPTLEAIAMLPVPVVSAVQGPAAGIGCSLALAADLCIAAEGAYFLQAFVNIALVPDGGSSWLLPRLVGRARALEMMMLGERISSSKAEQWGLIHKVVADKDLHAAGLALAGRLARGPTQALALIRQGVRSSFTEDLSVAFFREARDQRIARQTRDAAEGTEAFVQKRRPVFTGT